MKGDGGMHSKYWVEEWFQADSDTDGIKFPDNYAEFFLYYFFLILNLASPGSCNFYGARICSDADRAATRLSLSDFYFEIALLRGREGQWPYPLELQLDAVCDWYFACRRTASQVPHNTIEMVLFAFLHISKSDDLPTVVIWIFYALEILLDTKVGENKRALQTRIIRILKPDLEQEKIFKKKFQKLYDIRSSIVHGGLDVIHPMHNETLDHEVEKKYAVLSEAREFVFSILLCCLQTVIANGWHSLRFTEVFTGETLSSRH